MTTFPSGTAGSIAMSDHVLGQTAAVGIDFTRRIPHLRLLLGQLCPELLRLLGVVAVLGCVFVDHGHGNPIDAPSPLLGEKAIREVLDDRLGIPLERIAKTPSAIGLEGEMVTCLELDAA